ncbi:hypothetical protein GCM10028777_06350 [Angustibacter speluncae]
MTSEAALRYRDSVQAAIGVLVAQEEGRTEDVRRLLVEVGGPDDAVAAFFTVARLATTAAAHETGREPVDLLRTLSLEVARADPPPD